LVRRPRVPKSLQGIHPFVLEDVETLLCFFAENGILAKESTPPTDLSGLL
jgi:hypothetical protein